MAEVIDAHHHLWLFREEQFGWISDRMAVLRRDYMPEHLLLEMRAACVHGTVAVQARQSAEETDWLLACARQECAIRGVVGWLPIADPDFPEILATYVSEPLLKGLRHVVQDEPDDRFLLRPGFQRGIAALAGTGLVYDLLLQERHLPVATEFVAQHPQQVFVLDHLGKPEVGSADFARWRDGLAALAEHPLTSCKLSGLVTEADWKSWTLDDLRPYLDTALEIFSAERLMAGSDWPVCLVASSYRRWWETLREWAEPLPGRDKDLIFGGNASRVYRLADG